MARSSSATSDAKKDYAARRCVCSCASARPLPASLVEVEAGMRVRALIMCSSPATPTTNGEKDNRQVSASPCAASLSHSPASAPPAGAASPGEMSRAEGCGQPAEGCG